MAALSEALRLVRQPRPTFIEAQIQQELTDLMNAAPRYAEGYAALRVRLDDGTYGTVDQSYAPTA